MNALCHICGEPAVCYGAYEVSDPDFACDDCCGHGNEDGWCLDLDVDGIVERLARRHQAAEQENARLEKALRDVAQALRQEESEGSRAARIVAAALGEES
jgi:hypothetical protein